MPRTHADTPAASARLPRGQRPFETGERKSALLAAQDALVEYDRAIMEERTPRNPKDRDGYLLLIRCARLRYDLAADFA